MKGCEAIDSFSYFTAIIPKEVPLRFKVRKSFLFTSIASGVVPSCWKEAIVVPILKKGDPTDKSNYRPVSCLVTASKVMKKIVCNQVTRFLEINRLLSKNHVFSTP